MNGLHADPNKTSVLPPVPGSFGQSGDYVQQRPIFNGTMAGPRPSSKEPKPINGSNTAYFQSYTEPKINQRELQQQHQHHQQPQPSQAPQAFYRSESTQHQNDDDPSSRRRDEDEASSSESASKYHTVQSRRGQSLYTFEPQIPYSRPSKRQSSKMSRNKRRSRKREDSGDEEEEVDDNDEEDDDEEREERVDDDDVRGSSKKHGFTYTMTRQYRVVRDTVKRGLVQILLLLGGLMAIYLLVLFVDARWFSGDMSQNLFSSTTPAHPSIPPPSPNLTPHTEMDQAEEASISSTTISDVKKDGKKEDNIQQQQQQALIVPAKPLPQSWSIPLVRNATESMDQLSSLDDFLSNLTTLDLCHLADVLYREMDVGDLEMHPDTLITMSRMLRVHMDEMEIDEIARRDLEQTHPTSPQATLSQQRFEELVYLHTELKQRYLIAVAHELPPVYSRTTRRAQVALFQWRESEMFVTPPPPPPSPIHAVSHPGKPKGPASKDGISRP